MRDRRSDRWLWLLISILCATAVAKVAVQDVPRIRFSSLRQNDVQQLYLGSRVWMRGENPYSLDALFLEMKRVNPDGVAELNGPCVVDCHLYYPPPALPVVAALAFMPWKLFHSVYLASCILVYFFALYRLSLLVGKSVHRWLFISLGLAFSPYHSGLDSNNISVLLIPLLLLATLCFDSPWAFALIGVIASLKPPLVIVLFFYYLLRKDMRVVTVSAPIVLAISAISLLRLRGITWLPTYMNSIHDYSGGTMGVTYHDILNYGFSNLQAPFYALLHNPHFAVVGNYVTLALFGVLFTWSVLAWPAAEMPLDAKILALSIVGCLTLFQASLQYYNYVFLLGVAVVALRHPTNAVRLALMAALCTFVFPPGLLLSLSRQSRPSLNATLQVAQSKYFEVGHLTRGQELLVCIPSIIFLLITSFLVAMFRIRSRRLASAALIERPHARTPSISAA